MSDDNDYDNLPEKLRQLSNNPLKGVRRLRKDFTAFDQNATEGLYTYLAMAFQVFLLALTSAELKRMIIFALKPKSKKPDDQRLLRLVLRYLLDAPAKGAVYDRARVYAAVLEALFEKGTDPDGIPSAIHAGGGIEKIYKTQMKKKRLAKNGGALDPTAVGNDHDDNDDETDSPGSENERDGDGSGGDDGDDDDDDDDTTLGGRVTGGASPSTPAPKKPPRIPFNPRTDLVVRCETEAQLVEVLESKIKSGLFYVEFHYREDGTVELILRDWDPE